jgi:hypothetical protein
MGPSLNPQCGFTFRPMNQNLFGLFGFAVHSLPPASLRPLQITHPYQLIIEPVPKRFLRFETGSFLTKRKKTGEKYGFLRPG